ncbi:Serine protease inhibitor 28Dc [Blattella germanica]|nr:Serine protease inhibitor 28Dc [Blattella germanica]
MMVTGADLPYYYDKELGCQIVGLPYKDHAATMYLILPDEAGLGALKQLKNRMTINHMHQLADLTVETTTIIAVPRMQLESTIHLKHALKMLGVHSLFTPSQADLSKISSYSPRPPTHNYQHSNVNSSHLHVPQTSHQSNAGQQKRPEEIEFRASDTNPGLYVEDIIHKVTVDITETGTEASAASVVSITRDGTHKVVRFERPFLFFIRHRTTGIVLFWGTVTKPVPNQSTYVKQ